MKLVIFGNGSFAALASYVIAHDSPYEVAGFTVDSSHLDADTLCGLPVVAFEEIETRFPPDSFNMIAPLGPIQRNALRARKHAEARAKGYRFLSYVSSRALVWPDLQIGENCMVFDGAIVQPFSRIGDGVIIRSAAQVSHHALIGSNCFLAGHSFVGGNAQVGDRCFLGAHSAIRDGVKVAAACVLGAGAIVTSAIEEEGVYVGVPARRVIREGNPP